jgi:superfamily II DNA or RNA helicase
LEQTILANPESIDYQEVFRRIFYNINYPDYLFSLPMGAGKTFLIASFIYLDLYFALREPENKLFAHNFLVLVPSGLKSSIAPSLRDIEHFDPSWVLPEPAGSEIKRMIRFEVLDQPKSAKKSNRARNPNAQKVNALASQPNPMGLIFLVNAEKVILEKLELNQQLELIESDDRQARSANELRYLLGKLPNLGIHIDEVHHATNDEIKLRQVVNKWNRGGTVTSVFGYSGTPYLSSPDSIKINDDVELRFKHITNTVYYYPLTLAIRRFLKKPEIKTASGLKPLEIIRRGVQGFYETYEKKVYNDKTVAKLAIYCGSIERLEEDVYPFLRDKLKIPEADILKYHKGNAKYKTAKDAELEFASLDTPVSKKRVILLVQVGKEGWNCRSLTGVILAQKGDSPTNMVLQTSCRCLRQVDKGKNETALIWLNEENVKTLDKQLKEEQHTSVQEINNLQKGNGAGFVERHSRAEYLNLPKIDFWQLRIQYEDKVITGTASPAERLQELLANLNDYKTAALVKSGEVTLSAEIRFDEMESVSSLAGGAARFDLWLAQIARESFNTLSYSALCAHESVLEKIFAKITRRQTYNDLYDHDALRSAVRVCFAPKRDLTSREEVIPEKAELLLAEKLTAVENHPKLYPPDFDVKTILSADKNGMNGEQTLAEHERRVKRLQEEFGDTNLLANLPAPGLAVRMKEHTLHYLPYDFRQSGFEKQFLETCLQLAEFKNRKLEIYYNGERGLTGFVIHCFQKKNNFWKRLGEYTPDFLILQRKGKKPNKVLIVETKGEGFALSFESRKQFMESDFLRINKDKFGYEHFEFLFLRDDEPMEKNIAALAEKIQEFFN